MIRTTSSWGSVGQSAVAMSFAYDKTLYEKIAYERDVLHNELVLLERTQENIVLFNCGTASGFAKRVVVVGFNYTPNATCTFDMGSLRYTYDTRGDMYDLASYTVNTPEITLTSLYTGYCDHRMYNETLFSELRNIRAELRALDIQMFDLFAYAPGGKGHRVLVRRAAQYGMTPHFLRQAKPPWSKHT